MLSLSLSFLPPLLTVFRRSSILPFKSGSKKRRKKAPEPLMPRHLSLPPFHGLRSHHFQLRKAEYRIAYRIREDKRQVEIVLVKSRERFYEVIVRLIQ